MEQVVIHHTNIDPESIGGFGHFQNPKKPSKGEGGEGGHYIEKNQNGRGQGRTREVRKNAGEKIELKNIDQKVSAWDETPLDP